MIRHFYEIGVEDISVVGGKGANLGEMTRGGINVPPGFVVTADAYRLFLTENNLTIYFQEKLADIGSDENGLLALAEEFREKIRRGKLPKQITEEVARAYVQLGENVRVAVRSSATAEDLEDASFAGQQETYLNVVGLERVFVQLRECYASLWGNRAVVYRQKQGFDHASVALAVVIQKMVESEVAGVMFTVNPLTGNADEMQLNASYGLGESVVSGKVTADSFVCSKKGMILSQKMGDKKTQIVYQTESKTSDGTIEKSVEPKNQNRYCVSEEQVLKICHIGKKVEDFYKKPMDIEWAMVKNEVYILQARAITTLGKRKDEVEECLVQQYLQKTSVKGAQRVNMAFMLEKMPMVYYPLDYELIEVIDNQKATILAEGGICMEMQPPMDEDGIMILPKSKVGINSKISQLPALLMELTDEKQCVKKLRAQMEKLRGELTRIKEMDDAGLSLKECADKMQYLFDYIRRLTYCRFKYALFPGTLLGKKLSRILKKTDDGLNAYDLYQNLDYETAVMNREIRQMAMQFSRNPELTEAIRHGMSYEKISEKYVEARERLDAFLQVHGYKSDYNCYCISAKAFYDDPNRVLQIVRPLLGKEMEPMEATYEELLQRLKKGVSAAKYEKLVKQIEILRYMHVIREESQLMWETCFFYIRRLLHRVSGLLDGQEDYFESIAYLQWSELRNACERGRLSQEDKRRIEKRKELRPVANRVWEGEKLKVFPDTGETLKGVSGSVGEVIGKVCIVNGPEEFCKFEKGDVLVCRLTDPEWTPLFSLASAVVADTGAALSHAAIVAREYGIPAVLGVGRATIKYKDGDLVRVNGTKGEVAKIER